MDEYSLKGKHVLVTGATGGLGVALVQMLAEREAVIIGSSRSEAALRELSSTLPDGTLFQGITADLSIPAAAETLAQEAIDAAGHIDLLFNLAGMGYYALAEEASRERIRYLFELNTFSPLALIKALLPTMKKRGAGRVVNIVSCSGRVPVPSAAIYGGSKAALASITNTMRVELQPSGIDILNIYPGTVDTSFEENALKERELGRLCPTDSCGAPRTEIAAKILAAAVGPAGEIWLDSQGKWMSMATLIWPKLVDRRLEPLRDRVISSPALDSATGKRLWRLWQIESSIACNLRCVMCPWKQERKNLRNRGLLSREVWNSLRPYLNEVSSIDFTGGGEPLLHPHLGEWIREAKNHGCRTGFLSNGLLLTKSKTEEVIDAGIDWIAFSIDGASRDTYEKIRQGSDFARICENITNLRAYRVGKMPATMINFVMMRINFHEVEKIVKLADRLGVDQINFKQCDVIRGDHGKGFGLFASRESKEIQKMKKELSRATRLADKLNIKTTAFSFTPEEVPVCGQDPRDSLFIRHDGAVAPCINLAVGGTTTFLGEEVRMPTVHYGQLPDNDLMELWESEKCTFYRERFSQRIAAHDRTLATRDDLGTSLIKMKEAFQAAIDAMPEAPEGCRVCHYLYDI